MGNVMTMPKMNTPSTCGTPISGALRHSLESKFQTDLSNVRVHEGNEAVHLGVRSFTKGNDIYFAPGQTPPPLAAHEAWHVVQQAGSSRGGRNNENQEDRTQAPTLANGLVEVAEQSQEVRSSR